MLKTQLILAVFSALACYGLAFKSSNIVLRTTSTSTIAGFVGKNRLRMSINPNAEVQNSMSEWLRSINPGDTHKPRDVKHMISDADNIVEVMVDFWTVVCMGIDNYIKIGSPAFHQDLSMFVLPYFFPTVSYQKLVLLQELLYAAKPQCLHFGRPITLMHYHPDFIENNPQLQEQKHSGYWAKKRAAPFASLSLNTFYREQAVVDIEEDVEDGELPPIEQMKKGIVKLAEDLEKQDKQQFAGEPEASGDVKDIEEVMKNIYNMVNIDASGFKDLPQSVKEEAIDYKKGKAKELALQRQLLERSFGLPATPHPEWEQGAPAPAAAAGEGGGEATAPAPAPPSEAFYGLLSAEELATLQGWVKEQTGLGPVAYVSVNDSSAEYMYQTVWSSINELIQNAGGNTSRTSGIICPNFFPNSFANFYMFISSIQKILEAFPINHQISFEVFHPDALTEEARSPSGPLILITCQEGNKTSGGNDDEKKK